jgi:(2Fe-2S) ferredoxin
LAKLSEITFECHVFVCVNNRTDERKACAHQKSNEIRQKLKFESKKRWPNGIVRVTQTGCLGVCEYGPNVMIYPQNKWYSKVTPEDIDLILDDIDGLLASRMQQP